MSPSGGQQSLFAFIKMSKLNKDQVRAIKNAAELDGLSMADRKTLIKMIDDLNGQDQAIKLFVDGAADLHSKTAGIGGVIYSNDKELSNFSEPLFDKTNNEAEYLSLIEGIDKLNNVSSIQLTDNKGVILKEIDIKTQVIAYPKFRSAFCVNPIIVKPKEMTPPDPRPVTNLVARSVSKSVTDKESRLPMLLRAKQNTTRIRQLNLEEINTITIVLAATPNISVDAIYPD